MSKPRSNRLGMYSDIRAVLDAALAAGGGEYDLGDYGQAVHWRQRAYRFRKLYAETLGLDVESPYDSIVIRRVEPDTGLLRIQIRTVAGEFRPIEGGTPVPPTIDDDLLDFANSLAIKLDGGNNV